MVSTPLKNISQWEGLSHILWQTTNVRNHQPGNVSNVISHPYPILWTSTVKSHRKHGKLIQGESKESKGPPKHPSWSPPGTEKNRPKRMRISWIISQFYWDLMDFVDLVGFHGIQCEKNEVLADITPRTVVYL